MISTKEPTRTIARPTFLIMLAALPFLGLGCGSSSDAVQPAPPPQLPKIKYTKKERAKFNEMDREEMLEYKKQIRAERERRAQG